MSKPKIRFKGYEEDWEQRKFGNVTELKSASRVHKEEWTTSGVPFYRSSDVMAAINGTENEKVYISEALYEKLSSISGKLEAGDVLVTGGGSVGKPYIVPNNEPLYTKDADLLWIKNQGKFHPYFLYEFFFTPTFRSYLSSISHVGTIAHYTITQLSETPICLPSVGEQQKIGDYFYNIDHLITLHQRKCEETKKLKKYMLQKMFPQNGKRVPEIRFVGFTEDWEQRKVKEFAIESEVKGHSGKDAKKLTVKLHNKGVYVADEKIQGSDNTQYYIRRAGQFIYGKQNFFNGAIGIVPKKLDKYESTKDVPAFDVSSDVNVDWLYYYIARPEIYKPQEALCTGTGSKRFHVNNFYNLSLAIPKMDEQIKIKEYFVHLDNLITLHQRQYQKLFQ